MPDHTREKKCQFSIIHFPLHCKNASSFSARTWLNWDSVSKLLTIQVKSLLIIQVFIENSIILKVRRLYWIFNNFNRVFKLITWNWTQVWKSWFLKFKYSWIAIKILIFLNSVFITFLYYLIFISYILNWKPMQVTYY